MNDLNITNITNITNIPDIVLPVGHGSIPWRAAQEKVPVTVKFSLRDSHEDFISFQIWFEYETDKAALEQINRSACVKYINPDTFLDHVTGRPWTPHSCYYCLTTGKCSLRYWAGSLLKNDVPFEADTPEMFVKQITNIIVKGRKIYPKKKMEVDYSI